MPSHVDLNGCTS